MTTTEATPTPSYPPGMRKLANGSFQYRWTDSTGQRQQVTGNYHKVKKAMGQARHKADIGDGYKPALLNRRLESFAPEFFNDAKLRLEPGSYQSNKGYWNRVIQPALGEKKVAGLDREVVVNFANDLKTRYEPQQVIKITGILAQMLDRIYDMAGVKADKTNPARRLGIKRVRKPVNVVPLEPDQLDALARAISAPPHPGQRRPELGDQIKSALREGRSITAIAHQLGVAEATVHYYRHRLADPEHPGYPQFGLMVEFDTLTGLRPGELFALRPCDLAKDLSMVTVAWSLASVTREIAQELGMAESVYRKGTKTDQIRHVPIPEHLRTRLADLVATRNPDDYLFQMPEGGPIHHTNFMRRHFKPAARAIGRPELGLHGCRHCFASIMHAQGAEAYDLMRLMGHSSISVTYMIYTHLFPGRTQELSAAASAAYGPNRPRPELDDQKVIPMTRRAVEAS